MVNWTHAFVLKTLVAIIGSLFILADGDVSPYDGQQTACQGHPHDTNGTWYTSCVLSEMELSQQKSKGRRLHRCFDGHGAGFDFTESSQFWQEVSDETTNQVQEEDRYLRI